MFNEVAIRSQNENHNFVNDRHYETLSGSVETVINCYKNVTKNPN